MDHNLMIRADDSAGVLRCTCGAKFDAGTTVTYNVPGFWPWSKSKQRSYPVPDVVANAEAYNKHLPVEPKPEPVPDSPFSGEDGVCSKCGERDADIKWLRATDLWLRATDLWWCAAPPPPPDRIVRTCRRCGYSWREMPLDQGAEK